MADDNSADSIDVAHKSSPTRQLDFDAANADATAETHASTKVAAAKSPLRRRKTIGTTMTPARVNPDRISLQTYARSAQPSTQPTSGWAALGWSSLNGLSDGTLLVVKYAMLLGGVILMIAVFYPLAWANSRYCPPGDALILRTNLTGEIDPKFATMWVAAFKSDRS